MSVAKVDIGKGIRAMNIINVLLVVPHLLQHVLPTIGRLHVLVVVRYMRTHFNENRAGQRQFLAIVGILELISFLSSMLGMHTTRLLHKLPCRTQLIQHSVQLLLVFQRETMRRNIDTPFGRVL